MKKDSGITLIALIITIIVMLILSAITIRVALNGGLFGYAGNAAQSTKAAYENESQLGTNSVNVDNEEYTTIQDYVDSLNRETYGLRSDGKFYVNPNSGGESRIYSGLVYDSEHFCDASGMYGGRDVYAVWDEGYYRPYGYEDWEIWTADGEFYCICWAD